MIVYVIRCFINKFAWILVKRAVIWGIILENVGIILKIIGGFKKNLQKEYLEYLKVQKSIAS